jgi:cardiolipin synthase
MNFALRYVKGRHNRGWRDTMMRIEGSGVYSLQRAFLIDWYFVDRTQLSDKRYYPKSEEDAHGALLQTVTSAPLAPYPEIMQGYLRIILSAKSYIYIQSPYFLPTETIFFALKTAVASGVDVRVMVPRKTDGWFVEWGSRSYLREAQEAGIQILLYEPRFLHAKMLVCDDHTTTCGSTNIDFRSFLNNFEANTFVYDEDVALQMKDIFLRDASQSTPLSVLPKRLHPKFFVRLGESVMRLLSPLL